MTGPQPPFQQYPAQRPPVAQPLAPVAPPGMAVPQFVQALPQKSNRAMIVVNVIIIVIAAISIIVLLTATMLSSALPIFIVSLPLAIVTLASVWLVVWFIDRWEPKPVLPIAGALLWGGGIATVGALITGTIRSILLPGLGDGDSGFNYSAQVEAPISEEIWKGLGLLIIMLVAKRHFRGPNDGIVYGCLLGAGFAFTENMLYFASIGSEAGVFGLFAQFVVRGIALPFLHPICVSFTGIGVGLGIKRGGAAPYIGFLAGLVPAMLLHAIWNNGATVISGEIIQLMLFFFFVMVPIFIGWILLVVFRRRHDARSMRGRLGEYAAAGWFSPAELEMLTTTRGRVNARRWAAGIGPVAKRAMSAFISCASELDLARERMIRGWNVQKARDEERALLEELPQVRAQLAAAQHGAHLMVVPPQQHSFSPPQSFPPPQGPMQQPFLPPQTFPSPHVPPQLSFPPPPQVPPRPSSPSHPGPGQRSFSSPSPQQVVPPQRSFPPPQGPTQHVSPPPRGPRQSPPQQSPPSWQPPPGAPPPPQGPLPGAPPPQGRPPGTDGHPG